MIIIYLCHVKMVKKRWNYQIPISRSCVYGVLRLKVKAFPTPTLSHMMYIPHIYICDA